MGKASRAKQQRRGSVAQVKKKSGPNWGYVVGIAAVVVVGGGLIAYALLRGGSSSGSDSAPVAKPAGVEEVSAPAGGEHRDGDISYDEFPPPGGPHNSVWMNCGFYSEPIRTENAVHSLEHGAVWVVYPDSLDQSGRDSLKALTKLNTKVLVSASGQLAEGEVWADAWGARLKVASASDPRLEQFVRYYRTPDNVKAPEPSALCAQGTGTPG